MTDEPNDDDDDPAEPELSATERGALDAWPPMAPPAGFADRVLAARPPAARSRLPRRVAIGGALAATLAAAAALAVVLRGGDHTAHGSLAPIARETAAIGDRAVVVAEPAARLAWDVAADGATTITQPAGDVFYRVDHGGPFVVHTPAGDIHVTGTCFRIEVQMNKSLQLVLSGIAGAAVATAVVVTVYEGHVIADTHGTRSELAPGSHTVLDLGAGARPTLATPTVPVPPEVAAITTTPALDVEHASRDQLVTRLAAQDAELAHLRATAAHAGGAPYPPPGGVDMPFPDGRAWHDPSPETLKQWAAECRLRYDAPSFDHPADAGEQGLTADEAPKYNAAVSDIHQKFSALVRTLYIATTGDPATAETLSLDGMITEILAKAPPGEQAADGELLAQERAGLAPVPADTTRESPLLQLLRAQLALGDQLQAALADHVGAARAAAIRGDGFGMRREMAGCPEPAKAP